MKKINRKNFSKKFFNVINRMGQQRHLSALRDAFATFLPFLIVGAAGLLMITIIFGGWDSEKNSLLGIISKWSTGSYELTGGFKKVSDGAVKFFSILPTGTFDSISIYIVIFVPWYLAKSKPDKEHESIINGFMSIGVSMFAFLGLSGLDTSWFGANGLLPAIIISIVVTELFLWLNEFDKLKIKMPNSVPPAVARAFSKLIAIILVALIVAAVNYLFILIGQLSEWDVKTNGKAGGLLNNINQELSKNNLPEITKSVKTLSTAQYSFILNILQPGVAFDSVHDLRFVIDGDKLIINYDQILYAAGDWGFMGFIYQIITAPLMALTKNSSGGLSLALLYVFLVGLLWFFGLHGANMMAGIFSPLWYSALSFNVLSLKNNLEPEYIFAQPFFEGFIWVGGGMGTLMLIAASLIFSRRKEEREVAKFALVPGIFNINEPVVFGYPIVLNWVYFIPFVFIMPLQVVVTWLFMGPLGIVSKPTVALPWTTPPILGSLIVTKFDWKSIFPALINIAMSFILYVPFVLSQNRKVVKVKENKHE